MAQSSGSSCFYDSKGPGDASNLIGRVPWPRVVLAARNLLFFLRNAKGKRRQCAVVEAVSVGLNTGGHFLAR